MGGVPWKRLELAALVLYALGFYLVVIQRSLRLSHDYSGRLYGLRAGSLAGHLNDLSDAQWRNFRGNLPILTVVMGTFLIVVNTLRYCYGLKGRGTALLWLILSLSYLCYLHGACVVFILLISLINYSIVKLFAHYKYCTSLIWSFNLSVLILNRVYEGYSFSLFGQNLAFLDNHRGTFRWHICFNFVVLRMVSFGCDYCWTYHSSHFDHKKHMQRCQVCYSGKTCYFALQERGLSVDRYTFLTYLCYLTYAPLYIAGPIVGYNAFAAQLEVPQKNYSFAQISWYGLRWILSFLLMEGMTHFFHYNAFVVSRLWQQLSPFEIFIISYGRDWRDWGQEIKQQLAMNSRRRGDRDRGREINSRGLEAGRARRVSGEQGRGNPLESRGCALRRRAGSRGGRKLRRGSSPVAAGGGRKSRRAHACCGAMRRGRRGKPRQGQQGYGGLLLGWAVSASPDTPCPQIGYVPDHVSEFRENNKNRILPRYVSVAYPYPIRIGYAIHAFSEVSV